MLVEIWSDVVCPWCAIGRVRLDRALAAWEHADEVELRWRSFELDPGRTGTVDGDYASMLSAKYGTSRAESERMIQRMTRVGAEEGIEFRFDRARPGSTFDAHRLLHLAAERGVQSQVKQRFLDGYHTEGAAIAEHDEGDAYAAAVRADEQQAYEYGISGVPFFVLDGRAGLSGAQPVSHLLAALDRVRDEVRGDEDERPHPDDGAAEACAV